MFYIFYVTVKHLSQEPGYITSGGFGNVSYINYLSFDQSYLLVEIKKKQMPFSLHIVYLHDSSNIFTYVSVKRQAFIQFICITTDYVRKQYIHKCFYVQYSPQRGPETIPSCRFNSHLLSWSVLVKSQKF